MLPKLCHLDNDLEIIIIIYTVSEYEYIYCVVHMTYIPYLGTFFFSRYPSVALARNIFICTIYTKTILFLPYKYILSV